VHNESFECQSPVARINSCFDNEKKPEIGLRTNIELELTYPVERRRIICVDGGWRR